MASLELASSSNLEAGLLNEPAIETPAEAALDVDGNGRQGELRSLLGDDVFLDIGDYALDHQAGNSLIGALERDPTIAEQGKDYLADFDAAAEEDHITIGTLTLEQIQKEEERLQADLKRYEEERAEHMSRREAILLQRANEAKDQLLAEMERQRLQLQKQQRLTRQKRRLEQDKLNEAFLKAEQKLLALLKSRQAEVQATYGNLTVADGIYSGTKRRRWRLDWSHTPQPIQITMHALGGIRNKLSKCKLVLGVSLYDRLGGEVLRWSKLTGQEWRGTTLPFGHGGKFFHLTTKVNQSVFTVTPSEADINPSMVLVFELFRLRSNGRPFDEPAAWAGFPLVNTDFEIIRGKYRVPMLKGAIDPVITEHRELEYALHQDIDNWLCNLYFTVKRLPRYVGGQREYEVELQYTSGLLGFPQRQEPTAASLEDAALPRMPTAFNTSSDLINSAIESSDRRIQGINATLRRRRHAESSKQTREDTDKEAVSVGNGVTYRVSGVTPMQHYQRANSRAYNLHVEDKDVPDDESESTGAVDSQVSSFKDFHYSVNHHDDPKSHEELDRQKAAFVWRALRAELGFHMIKTNGYWVYIMCFLLAFWGRMYVHYLGQWYFLTATGIPVSKFAFRPVTVDLNYQASLLLAREEVAVVAFGHVAVMIMLLLLMATAMIIRRLAHRFFDSGWRFISAWAILTIFDPVLIALVDVCYQRWAAGSGTKPVGDAFKLYHHFERSDDGGLPGVFLTLFIYAITMFGAFVIAYIYFLRQHMDCRVIDLYHRLADPESKFVLPYDNEVSMAEVTRVVKAAERWRGQNGERRKTVVFDHNWRETEGENNGHDRPPKVLETTSLIGIHTIYMSGRHEVFRQFLRLPDGAVIEVFGSEADRLDQRLQGELEKSRVNLATLHREASIYVAGRFNSTTNTIGS